VTASLPKGGDVDDIVIPPKPPLPKPLAPTKTGKTAKKQKKDAVEADAPVAEPAPAAEPAAVPDPDLRPEPEPQLEPEPEPELEPEPQPAPGSELEPEPEPDQAVDTFAIAPAPGAPPVLVLRGIRKSFGETRAVDGIDLTVPTGTFYGIVGPNGAGKTTTLSMIAGLLRADKGTIHVNGVDAVKNPRGAKRLMGVLPDRLRTFDRLTGRQLLYYYGILRGLPGAVVESRTNDLARAFDLTDALGRVVSDYSAGMVKKVMLAGAMIHSPRLLVLDEPFEAVDPVSSAVILDILSTYVAHGGTVVLSSHGMELVERVCSRVAVIVAGQVLAEGTIDEVRGELTLEQRFIELAGGLSDVEGLEWLHTFSG
jgi:ABC-2 type transport system ATP-binding protein